MDQDFDTARSLLGLLTEVNEALIAAYFKFRSRGDLAGAHHGFDLRKTDTGCLLDMYVEAVVHNDLAYCWWLELRLESQHWSLDASLLRTAEGQQQPLSRIAESRGAKLEELDHQIREAVRLLAESAAGFQIN